MVELLAVAFDRQAITGTRHAVGRCAAAVGLFGARLDGFVLAVNEIMTNAVRHGGGRGRLRLWRAAGTVSCEVRDEGRAVAGRLEPGELPPTTATGGRGLWLARQLCDEVEVETGVAGTVVRVTVAI